MCKQHARWDSLANASVSVVFLRARVCASVCIYQSDMLLSEFCQWTTGQQWDKKGMIITK